MTNEELATQGWENVDNSGDGSGDTGFHMKPFQNGKFVLLMATDGSDGDEMGGPAVYPITNFTDDDLAVCLSIYQKSDGSLLPTTGLEFMEADGMGQGPSAEMWFIDVTKALEFAAWLEKHTATAKKWY